MWVGLDAGDAFGLGVYFEGFGEVGEVGELFFADFGLALEVGLWLGGRFAVDVESYASDSHLVEVEVEFEVLLPTRKDCGSVYLGRPL